MRFTSKKDPLLIYKFESFNLFKDFVDKVNKEIVSFLLKADLPTQSNVQEEKDKHRQIYKLAALK